MSFPEGISIVICTYNGVKRLQPTLEAIFKLTIQQDLSWELIIVDNASTDNTSSLCIDLIEKHQFQNKVKILAMIL
jgi:glycosyltransferase involved in cell wall biosynthesis